MNEQDIFLAAIEITDLTDRAAYVDEACGADASLRAQVVELLKSHDLTSQFLETPAVAADSAVVETMLTNPSDSTEESSDKRTSGEEEFRRYLQPATRPGWLGRLAHYEIEEILGRGAFGIVAKAFDEKLHRIVAIKLMNPELATTSPPRKRFLREARTAAAVTHENLVAIHAVEEEPIPYLVMEYVPGQTLQQLMSGNGPLEVADILRIGQQVASGLAAAHTVNLIHRDIKPSNILLTEGPNERAKISDFGLARAVDDASLTSSGLIAGTPMYMAPEQARGETLDHRADLFSLGSVLYQMASGHPPFRAANTVAVLRRVCEDTPRPLDDVIPGIPSWLATIIFRLLEKKRDDRFQSAQEVADLLARCQNELQHYGRVTCVKGRSGAAGTQVFQAKTGSNSRPWKKYIGWLIGGLAVVAAVVGLATMNGGGKAGPERDAASVEVAASPKSSSETAETPKDTGLRVVLPVANPAPLMSDTSSDETMASAIPGASPALVFDGIRDGVKVPFPDAESLPCTIEGWIIPAPLGARSMIFRIPEHIALTFESPTQWMMNIRRSETELIKEPITVSYQPTRIHFAVVINSGSVQVYYSGKLVYQREFDQGFQVHSSELYLGFNSTSADGDFLGFEGVLDECRISNIARYSEDFVPAKRFEPDEQTIALYHMDQNDEEQLTDSSGNGRHGRILSYSWSKNADAEMYQLQVEMDAFVAEVSLLAPEAQIEAFRLKMIEANPGYDGKLKHSVRNGNVTTLECLSDHMKTIWPVRVFKQLEKLHIGGQNSDTILTDLTPLKGLPLKDLDLRLLPASDLTPLKGMPLEIFGFYGGRLTDLAPISNCPLKELQLIYTSVTDLTPLKEMPLRNFSLRGSDVVDFSVLKGLPITHLDLADTKVSDLSPLQGMPLASLNVRLTAVTDLSSVEGLPLTDLDISETNVRDLSALQGMPLKKLSLFDATDISDLSPLQAAPIEELNMNGLKGVSDLSTLRGMKNLKSLFMDRTGVSDLTPIENLPIELLAVRGCPLLDLNAIKHMPLKQLFIPVRWFRPDEHQFLRSLPLETLNGSFFAGGMPVKEFWEQFDAQLQAAIEFAEATAKLPVEQQSDLVLAKLQELNENQEIKLETQITNNAVSTVKVTLLKSNENLTPLRAFGQMKELQIVGGRTSLDLSPIDIAPIKMLTCDRGIVLRNLPILREMPTLKTINGEPSKEYLDVVEADPWPKEEEVDPKAN